MSDFRAGLLFGGWLAFIGVNVGWMYATYANARKPKPKRKREDFEPYAHIATLPDPHYDEDAMFSTARNWYVSAEDLTGDYPPLTPEDLTQRFDMHVIRDGDD